MTHGYITVEFPILRCRVCGPVTNACEHDADDVTEVCLHVCAEVWRYPGKLYGPPEHCYPAESDFEIVGSEVGGWACSGLPDGLTDSETLEIETAIDDADWDEECEAWAC